ncbi:hypothetical protein SANTM175S_08800 [Streptomyces antimycoticus]
MAGEGVGHLGLCGGGGLRAGAEGVGVGVAVPLAVADVLELQLEGAHPERPHGVGLAQQRLEVLRGREAHLLAGGDRPAEGDVVGPGARGQLAELLAPLGGVGVAPASLPVRVVAGRVEIAVLLGAAHEVELGQPVAVRPRGAVEALGRASYGRPGPVADGHPGDGGALALPLHQQLAQGLDGVEETVGADAGQRDRGPPLRRARGQEIAAGREVAALGGAQGAQGVGRAPAAHLHHQSARRGLAAGGGFVDGAHPRVVQQAAQRVQGVRIGVAVGYERGLVPQGQLRPVCPQRLRARPYGRYAVAAVALRCGGARGAVVHRCGGGRGGAAEQPADDRGSHGRRPRGPGPLPPEVHGPLLDPDSRSPQMAPIGVSPPPGR